MPPTRRTRATNISPPRARNATIRRPSPTSAATSKPSIRLTVKAPPSKLRQALSNDLPPNPYADEDDDPTADTPEPPVRTARSTRNPRTVVEADSDEDIPAQDNGVDEDEGDEEEDDEGEEQADDQDEAQAEIDAELLDAEDSELEGAEDEDADADEDADGDGDLDMDAPHPPPPIIKSTKPAGKKAKVIVTAPNEGTLKSVEEREEEDEEMSELDDEEEEVEDDDEDEDDSGEDGSRDGTPDLSKLTRRQRATYEEGLDAGLMALSNEAQTKKHLTAEEHAMRRAEMARRRKNLSEKRNEEEKVRFVL